MRTLRSRSVAILGPCRDDSGMTLVEILVVMVLFGLIATMVTNWAIAADREVASTRIRLADIGQARVGMDALTKTLRTGIQPAQLQTGCGSCTGPASTSTALTTASPTSVQLFANFGAAAGPELVTFTFADDPARGLATLTETIQPPDAGSAPNFTYTPCTVGASGCPISRRVIVSGLVWPLPGPALVYYDTAGAVLAPGGTGQLSPQQRVAVTSIDITLPVRTPNALGAGTTTLTGRVTLPNSFTGVLPTPSPTP